MKEVLILSGKGGTGKTTLASSLIEIGNLEAYADCDVDAPNLQVFYKGESKKYEAKNYYGLDKAQINTQLCISCGTCIKICEFNAINFNGNSYKVDEFSCEGCSLCAELCPSKAIDMMENIAGETKLYKNGEVFSTAKLKMGQGNSGLLVTEVKKNLNKNIDNRRGFKIIDGSPGIGCPVIASIKGADILIIISEPSLSGIEDLDRIVKTGKDFNIPIYLVINKYDINLDNVKILEDYAKENNLEIIGKIAFDKKIVDRNNRVRLNLDKNDRSIKEFEKIYNKIKDIVKQL